MDATGPATAGNGLRGLRERVAAVGGRLTAGATPTGFRLAVEVPCPAPTRGRTPADAPTPHPADAR